MSTSTSPPPRKPHPTASGGQRADRDIDRQLDKTRRDLKMVDLFSSLMVWAAGVVAFLLLAAVIDHWILPLAGWARWLLLAGLSAGSLAYLAVVILPLLLGRINPLYAARAIERSEPSLKNSVINFLLFREDRAGLRLGIYEALKQRAAADLSHVQLESAVDRSRLIHIGYGLIAVLVLFAAYTILSPKSPLQTVRRVAAPWAEIARPTRVRIEEVQPGSGEVYYGDRIAVSAACYDLYEDEPVMLFYSSLDGRITEQSLRMQAGSAGLRYEAQLPPGDEGLQQDLIYRLQAGDAVTPAYRLTVRPAPTLLVQQVEYAYPPYTRQPARVVERQGDVKGLEGTRVTVRAVANQPIRWAALQLHPAAASGSAAPRENAAAVELPPENVSMSFDGQQAWGTFVLQLDGTGRPRHAAYQLRFETLDGYQNDRAPLHRLEVSRDLSPEIEILTPLAERIELPLDRAQAIEVRGIDPDYGLRTISLRVLAGATELIAADLLDDPTGRSGQFIGSRDFKPWEHGLSPGDGVVFWAVAADNRVSPQTGEPEPNLAKTRTYHVTILPPENPAADPQQPGEEPEPASAPGAAAKPEPGGAEDAAGSDATGSEAAAGQQQPEGGGAGDQSGQQAGAAGGAGESDGGSSGAGSGAQQQGGAGQSAADSGGDSADSSGSGGSNASSGGQSGSSAGAGNRAESGGGQSPSPGSGGPAGSAGGEAGDAAPDAAGSPENGQPPSGGTATATGQQAAGDEPLHDGEVIERTLEYMQSQQEPHRQPADADGGRAETDPTSPQPDPAGGPPEGAGDRPQQSSEGNPQEAPPGTAAQERPGQQPAGSQEAQQAQTDAQPAGGGQQQADRSQGAGQQRDGSAGEGGRPKGPAETRPEQSPQGAGASEPRQGGLGDTGDSGRGQASQDQSGAPEAQKQNRDQEKTGEGGDPQPQPSEGAQSPSQSKRQRNLPGGAAGDQSGEGSQGGGQGAGQAGNDSPGSQSSADDGAGASQESGAGDTAPRPGGQQLADRSTGSPGTQQGAGSSTQPEPGSSGAGGTSPEAANPGGPQATGQPASGDRDDRGQGVPLGGGRPGAANPGGRDFTGEVPPGDEPNLEYARRSTEMVLEYLRDQQQRPDTQLLDQLGWSEDDLKQFLQRWESLRQASAGDDQAQRELNDALRSLGLRPAQATRRASGRPDQVQGLRENGAQSSPPARYLEQFNAYKKGTARVDE